jgi:hypothetical protein
VCFEWAEEGTGSLVFSAILIEKNEAGQSAALKDLGEGQLPDGSVIALGDAIVAASQLMAGQVRGRIVVDVNR